MRFQTSKQANKYANNFLGWTGSNGDVYEKLGFCLVQERDAVEFYVDKKSYKRVAVNKFAKYETDILQNADVMQIDVVQSDNIVRIKNRGSKKYLLQQPL